MRRSIALPIVVLWFLLCSFPVLAAKVESFSPRGETKGVRQVVVKFSAPTVAFGDPRSEAPFEVSCAAPGRGRWIDARVWAYDFNADVPGGIECAFVLKAALRSQSGEAIDGERRFVFNTGGPSISTSWPEEGSTIDESQVFLLALDAVADAKTVTANAYCQAVGITERLPLRFIEGDERNRILTEQRGRARNFFAVLTKQGTVGTIAVKDKRMEDAPLLLATCARRLPPGAEVKLVWGAGIRAVAGGESSAAQTLPFQVRRDFVAKLTCTHVNKDAGCVPVLPIELELEAPVARSLAEQIRLQGADGTRYPALLEEKVVMIERVSFKGPFPPRTALSLVLPEKFVDDAGRPLVNAASFPMKVAIDEDPPLIKFPSRFGILERNASPALPVTVRNVEAPLKGLMLAPLEAKREGTVARVTMADDAALAGWLKRVLSGPRANGRPLPVKAADAEGQFSIFEGNEARVETRTVELPRSSGDKAFEVIGIPLMAPGFHVVEFASPRLGAALFGAGEPYYVYSSALVTNLAVHFKRGRESSLVWVTTLDGAKPVAGAKVAVNDCLGAPLWSGETDAKGLARVERELPQDNRYQDCPHAPTGLLVTARSGDDLSFALTTWNEGIRSWNFNLGTRPGADGPVAAHTVFDRPLFRAGEIVSMKHFLRLRTGRGFAAVDPKSEPGELVIRHVATDQTYAQKLVWQGGAASSTWSYTRTRSTRPRLPRRCAARA